MLKHNQYGAVSGLAVSLVLAVVLLIGAIVFGAWAFSSRQDYKNNTDGKVAVAVADAKSQEDKVKDAQFAEAEKQPLRTYNGPEAYGSLVINYPKTWSGYVDTSGGSDAPLNGYFYPGIVPSVSDPNSVFALRVQIVNQDYSTVLKNFANPLSPGQTRTITPYALRQVPKVIGVEINGALTSSKVGTMVVLPLRSETLEIWTEGNQYTGDFNKYILPNFSFSP